MRLIPGLATAALLAACTASPTPTFTPADCAQADADNVVTIAADDLEFDAPCIAVPADTAFTIRFTNLESTPHNVAIYDTDEKVNEYLRGEHINQDVTTEYEVDPLAAGEYYFECNVHPPMNGTLFSLAEGEASGG